SVLHRYRCVAGCGDKRITNSAHSREGRFSETWKKGGFRCFSRPLRHAADRRTPATCNRRRPERRCVNANEQGDVVPLRRLRQASVL
ncbi:hypothetical protein TGPRC2_318400D, partial [Toxoplasma gondii TgCatPRC2]